MPINERSFTRADLPAIGPTSLGSARERFATTAVGLRSLRRRSSWKTLTTSL